MSSYFFTVLLVWFTFWLIILQCNFFRILFKSAALSFSRFSVKELKTLDFTLGFQRLHIWHLFFPFLFSTKEMLMHFKTSRIFKKTSGTFIIFLQVFMFNQGFKQHTSHQSVLPKWIFCCMFTFEIWLFWEILKIKDTSVYRSFRWAFPGFVLIFMQFKNKLPSIDLQVSIVKPARLCGFLAQQKK